jgi:hypothetical protein
MCCPAPDDRTVTRSVSATSALKLRHTPGSHENLGFQACQGTDPSMRGRAFHHSEPAWSPEGSKARQDFIADRAGAEGRQKSESCSGGSFVDVVQAAEDRTSDHFPGDRPIARDRGLQLQGTVGPILVVVTRVLGQHRPDMPLA